MYSFMKYIVKVAAICLQFGELLFQDQLSSVIRVPLRRNSKNASSCHTPAGGH